jgi:hypothetical protein
MKVSKIKLGKTVENSYFHQKCINQKSKILKNIEN